LTAYQREQDLQDKQIMDYRTQMAAYRAAQAQAANEAAAYNRTNVAAGAGAGAAPAGGVTFPPGIQRQLDQLPANDIAGRRAIEQKYLNMVESERAKPVSNTQTSYWIESLGKNVPMTPNEYVEYKATGKLPGAAAVVPTTAAAPTGQAVKVAAELGVPVISGDRDWDKQYNLYLDSLKPGYKGNPVAFPGTSKHQTGNAIDTARNLPETERQKLIGAGFKQTVPNDPGHWELVGAPAAARPTPAAPSTQKATSPEEFARRNKEQEEIGSSRIKEGEAKRNEILQSRESSIETGNAIGRIENTLNTPEGVRAVGVFNKPGVVSAFGKILSEGVQAGNFGSVSFKGLEDAVRAAGGDQKTIDAAQSLARDFAQMQLNIAKRDLKGQGAVSDNERAIVAKVTGSTANSPEVLKDFTRWNRVRNTFDKQVGDALQNWEERNPNQPYVKFKQSAEYKQLENDYIAKTDAMASKMGITGKKAAPSDTGNKVNEYLKKYGPKKES